MRGSSLCPALFASVLGCAAISGCHHCTSCGAQSSVAAAPAPQPQVAVAAAPTLISPYAGQPAPTGPVVHQVMKPANIPDANALDHQEWQTVSGIVHEKLMDRRTFTDLTVNPAFAHA